MDLINQSPDPFLLSISRTFQKSSNWRNILALLQGLIIGCILMNHETAGQEIPRGKTPLVCNINGIPLEKRTRYEELIETLHHAVIEKTELPDGYAFRIDTTSIGVGHLVEWVELERQCCPFFGFDIRWEREAGPLWLHLTGPDGIKDFILDEFGLR
jgi:hypothetical protein